MKEFYSIESSNERKRALEQLLQDFSNQQGAWQHCLYFLAHSVDPYVCMYSLTTIETVINKQWVGLLWDERSQLKSALYQLVLERHSTVPTFVRNKLVKVVVDTARLDWPHFYPDFLSNIVKLFQHPDTVSLGLVFLQTSSEELISSREDLSVSRKEELRRLLYQQVPSLFSILTDILEQSQNGNNGGSSSENATTATPPPSPTHGQPHSASPPGPLISSMLTSGGRSNSVRSAADGVVRLALEALTHFLSWVPLGPHITLNLTSTVFHHALAHRSTPSNCGNPSLSVLAIGGINEIFYKKCVPGDWEDNFLTISKQSLAFVHDILPTLDDVSDDLLEKMVDLLRLLISQHLHRLEKNPAWPIGELLTTLLRFTFQQPSLEGYFQCLDIWGQLLDYLQQRQNSQLNTRYQEALVMLVSQVLKKIQFRQNLSELDLLDDCNVDDDGETEWQKFLRESIESIARVAELAPVHIYALVLEPWKEVCSEYTHLCSEKSVSNPDLQYSIRDLASLTQAIGRFCPHFTGESFIAGFQQAQQLVQGLVAMVSLATKLRPHRWPLSPPSILYNLLLVHAQVLAALKAWSHWVAQLQVGAMETPTLRPLLDRLVSDMVRASVMLVQDNSEPTTLAHSAAHLFLTLTRTVKPTNLWNFDQVRNLYSNPLPHLKPETQSVVRQALCSAVVVVGGEDNWEERHKMLTKLIETITADLRNIASSSNQSPQDAAPVLAKTFHQLSDLVENTPADSIHGRKLLCSCIQPLLEQGLGLFPIFVSNAQVSEQILRFFLAAFGSLQVQLGATFTEQAVQTFLNCFTREQLSECLQQDKNAGVERFLQILQLIVTQPNTAFKHFIPSSITLCMDHIYPVIAEHPAPSVKPALFDLLFSILLHKWQYFYYSTAIVSEHKAELLAVLTAFGQSLVQSDINIFKQNLNNLETLNTRWKLYHKAEFYENLLVHFLSVLLNALINKSHDLLCEDIAIAVFNMASVNFSFFFSSFLPEFLQNSEQLDDSQRSILLSNFNTATDLPSFTQNVSRLANDTRCYKICNSCRPAGSIQL